MKFGIDFVINYPDLLDDDSSWTNKTIRVSHEIPPSGFFATLFTSSATKSRLARMNLFRYLSFISILQLKPSLCHLTLYLWNPVSLLLTIINSTTKIASHWVTPVTSRKCIFAYVIRCIFEVDFICTCSTESCFNFLRILMNCWGEQVYRHCKSNLIHKLRTLVR